MRNRDRDKMQSSRLKTIQTDKFYTGSDKIALFIIIISKILSADVFLL